jgi:hypothetical protein
MDINNWNFLADVRDQAALRPNCPPKSCTTRNAKLILIRWAVPSVPSTKRRAGSARAATRERSESETHRRRVFGDAGDVHAGARSVSPMAVDGAASRDYNDSYLSLGA